MSNSKDGPGDASRSEGGAGGREEYEAPRLTTVGNARDLLAGASGSIADQDPCACLCADPTQPSVP
jgi:hypothetical protein